MLRAKTQGQYKLKIIKVAGLAILFCLLLNPFVYAAAPTLGTISPSSGSTAPNVAITFTTTYSDTDGWANLKEAYFLISTSSTALANSAYLYYDQNTNKLYLRNDANSAWLGGYAPGSANVIENSYVKLACASTTVSGSTNTMTVRWNVTFKTAYSGRINNTYLKIKDDTGGSAGWTKKGTWTIQQADTTPPVISINPVISPTNQDVTLSYTATDNITPSGQIIVSGDNSPYTAEGSHNVTLTARDLAGNTSTASVNFTIDKTPPAIIITSPQNGTVVGVSPVQLEGTVDGTAFSESRTLSAGENILTKTAADEVGNTNSASIMVYLSAGQLIGPQGGEVISADGKVKVVIPSGALNTPAQIEVLNVNKETLEGTEPGGTALLSVVECKPYGLVFNKPVSIIYTLAQAEIPGTPVELGFYDAVQNKIIPTGQTSTMPADGYKVIFSLLHFSTYAALKNLTSQGAPIGGGVKIPLPDMFTGAFSHAIPISVAPGRKGMQPAIGLSYRSSNPNSWVGLGFSLNSGFIVRSTRLGPPAYIDTQDTFYLITDAGTTELVHLIDNLYQAKIESAFAKFYKEPDDSWKVVGKDGSVLRFGQISDAKETSSAGTFSWYLTRAQDTNGNYITYTYAKDQGKCYLSRIDYTGNETGISPTNSVEFFLESRNDVPSSYISGARIATARRLKEIQVRVGYDLVWRYELEYNYSLDTNRSLLKSVKQYTGDNKSLPAQALSYQAAK